IYSWIEDLYGERIAEVEQTLQARPIPPALAPKLHVAPDSTVVEVCRVYRLTTGLVAEIAFNLHPAERFRHAMTLRRESR
ncbi:MAG: UTRA domain-containing protein, partial [Bauldia sp.]